MKCWPEIIANVYWFVEDGHLSNFWNDMCLRKVGSLNDFYIGPG